MVVVPAALFVMQLFSHDVHAVRNKCGGNFVTQSVSHL